MKFNSITVVAATAVLSSIEAFQPISMQQHNINNKLINLSNKNRNLLLLYSTAEEQTTTTDIDKTEVESTIKTTKKNERLRMMKKDTFYRNGFKDVRTNVEETMIKQFKGNIVDELKSSNYVIERDNVKVYLAKVCM